MSFKVSLPKPDPPPAAKTDEAALKRAAQNRVAQRAFRQRRERYLRELEAKASQMDEANYIIANLNRENQMLRQEVAKLQHALALSSTRPEDSGATSPSQRHYQYTELISVSGPNPFSFQAELAGHPMHAMNSRVYLDPYHIGDVDGRDGERYEWKGQETESGEPTGIDDTTGQSYMHSIGGNSIVPSNSADDASRG